MYLLIFESIGTQELILIGIVALIFLGPRKLPEYMRKAGKLMNEFRNTTNEFKETWEREVNFEDEAKALKLDTIEEEASKPIARDTANNDIVENDDENVADAPLVREADQEQIERMKELAAQSTSNIENAPEKDEASDKGSWL